MTQVAEMLKTFVPEIERMAAERRTWDEEIAGTCPKHGDYTRRQADWRFPGISCPQCAEREAERQAQAQWVTWFKEQSGVPRRFQGRTLDDFAPPTPAAETVLATLRRYAQDFTEHFDAGRSLILCGRTGTGKTHLACALARRIALEHRHRCRYTTAYHIVRDIKDTYGREAERTEKAVVREFVEPHLLVVDEVGVQYGTDTEKLLLFEVLNGRYEDLKPTIVISNLEPTGIGEYLGDRVMDRLRENDGGILVFDWKSNRGEK